jgi:hypothetical protein
MAVSLAMPLVSEATTAQKHNIQMRKLTERFEAALMAQAELLDTRFRAYASGFEAALKAQERRLAALESENAVLRQRIGPYVNVPSREKHEASMVPTDAPVHLTANGDLAFGEGILRPLNKAHCFDTSPRVVKISGLWAPEDWKRLSTVANIVHLNLSGLSGVADLEFLRPLHKLLSLCLLGNNQISDLSPLEDLTELRAVDLRYCSKVEDASALSYLPNLEVVYLRSSGVIDSHCVISARLRVDTTF